MLPPVLLPAVPGDPVPPTTPVDAVPVLPSTGLRALELRALVAVQRRAGHSPVLAACRALGRFGDHAAGWLLVGAVGWLLDRPRRRDWVAAGTAVLGAHAVTVVVKRVLRRARPSGLGITVHAATPGRLSFPSSHAASSTAAALAYGHLLGVPAAPALVAPVMGLSRLVLGLHFPTDVAVGTAVGALVGRTAVRATAVRATAAAPRGGRR